MNTLVECILTKCLVLCCNEETVFFFRYFTLVQWLSFHIFTFFIFLRYFNCQWSDLPVHLWWQRLCSSRFQHPRFVPSRYQFHLIFCIGSYVCGKQHLASLMRFLHSHLFLGKMQPKVAFLLLPSSLSVRPSRSWLTHNSTRTIAARKTISVHLIGSCHKTFQAKWHYPGPNSLYAMVCATGWGYFTTSRYRQNSHVFDNITRMLRSS